MPPPIARKPTTEELRNDIRRRMTDVFPQPCDCSFFGKVLHEVKDRHERSNHTRWQAKQEAIMRRKKVQGGGFRAAEDDEDTSTLVGDSTPELEQHKEDQEVDDFNDIVNRGNADEDEDMQIPDDDTDLKIPHTRRQVLGN